MITVLARARQVIAERKESPNLGGGGGAVGRKRVSKHNPFTKRSSLGPRNLYDVRPPAPPPRSTRRHTQRKQWSCNKVAEYKQLCIGIGKRNSGEKLRIKIKRGYKKKYNKTYKHARTKERAAARREGRKPRFE